MSLYIRKHEVNLLKTIHQLYGDDNLPYWGTLYKVITRLEKERNKGNEKSKYAMQELRYKRTGK